MGDIIEIKHDDRTKVYFKLFMGNDKRIEISIRHGKLRIEGDSELLIQPKASNCIIVSSSL